MGNYKEIIDIIGEPAVLEMMAEEYMEAGQAALKLARIIRNENPTPVLIEEAVDHLLEEISDANLSASQWLRNQPDECAEKMNDNADAKLDRWYQRLNERYWIYEN